MLNQTDLSSINKGESIDHFLLVKKCEVRLTKNGKEYLSLELGDKSLNCPSNLWDDVAGFKSIKSSLAVGDIVKITGSMENTRAVRKSKLKLCVWQSRVIMFLQKIFFPNLYVILR